MKKLRHLLEYAALICALFVLDRVSLSSADSFARFMARLAFRLHASRRRTAIDNIIKCRITENPEEASRIARESFEHFAVLVMESLKSRRFIDEHSWKKRIELDVPDASMKLLEEQGRGVILVSGHLGNWEIAAQVLSFIKPVVGITKTMKNPYTERVVNSRKPRHRFSITPKHSSDPSRFLSILKRGEILALMIDQYTYKKQIVVDFFDIPTATLASPAMLHLVTGTPIIFTYCIRTGPMFYRIKASEPLMFAPTGNRDSDASAISEKLNHSLEAAIRAHPEQYVWAHRRWKE